jgi:membrane protein DedA with SNARE-associated domain
MFSFIAGIIQKTGVWGVGLLMLLENIVPIIPSELIMPMAGFEAARGALDPMATIALGTLGSVLGGVFWYWIGRRLGAERVSRWAAKTGRWLPLSPEDVDRGREWFQRWGAAAVFIGRMLPGVRGVICLPAGVARMKFGSFLLWSSLGALGWTALLAWTGYRLKAHYAQIGQWLNPAADAFLALCVLFYIVRVVRYRTAEQVAKKPAGPVSP